MVLHVVSGIELHSNNEYNWYLLVDGLQEEMFVVKLSNTVAIKKYDELKHSDDEADARQLAHLLRLGIYPPAPSYQPTHRAIHDLARKRMRLVHSRTLATLPRMRAASIVST